MSGGRIAPPGAVPSLAIVLSAAGCGSPSLGDVATFVLAVVAILWFDQQSKRLQVVSRRDEARRQEQRLSDRVFRLAHEADRLDLVMHDLQADIAASRDHEERTRLTDRVSRRQRWRAELLERADELDEQRRAQLAVADYESEEGMMFP